LPFAYKSASFTHIFAASAGSGHRFSNKTTAFTAPGSARLFRATFFANPSVFPDRMHLYPLISLRVGRSVERIAPHQIVRLTGIGNYTEFHLADGRRLISPRTLKIYQAILPDQFMRVHRGCLVNSQYVVGWATKDELLLRDGNRVASSRRKRLLVREQYAVLRADDNPSKQPSSSLKPALPTYLVLWFMLLLSLTGRTSALAQTIRYVSAAGVNSSPASATSWATATPDLQGAINTLSATGGQVWVRSGLYKPGGPANVSRSVSITIASGVAVYGGFQGIEITLAERQLTYPSSSTLSGEIGGTTNADNSLHVVRFRWATAATQLNGFVITGGNANTGGGGEDDFGAGIFNDGRTLRTSNPIIANCLVTGNTSAFSGAGIYNGGGAGGNASPTLLNCVFSNNQSQYGAAVFNDGLNAGSTSSPTLINCVFSANTATQRGGGAYNDGGSGGTSRPAFINCTFGGNTAGNGGSELYNSAALPTLTNCVVWNGSAGSNAMVSTQTVTVNYSLLSPGIANVTGSNNQTAASSPFANIHTANLRLVGCGPAQDAGSPLSQTATSGPWSLSALPVLDAAGSPRIAGAAIDLGAYEASDRSTRRFVKPNGTGDGRTWATASGDLQAMINSVCNTATDAGEVWVAAGTYKPTTTTNRLISFSMRNRVGIYGGFAGTETDLSERRITYPPTSVLSGDIGTVGNIADNSLHVIHNPRSLTFTESAILDGFAITGGNATAYTAPPVEFSLVVGGGLFHEALSAGTPNTTRPLIRNCRFIANQAHLGGAVGIDAVFGNISSPSAPTFYNCAFEQNAAVGTLFSFGNGGAVANFSRGLNTQARPRFTNCSFLGNTATVGGRAVYNEGAFAPSTAIALTTLENCALWGHGGTTTFRSVTYAATSTASMDVNTSLLEGGTTGYVPDPTSFTTATSPFVSTSSIQLTPCSPAINRGENGYMIAPTPTDTDITGNPRLSPATSGTVDIGACEFSLDPGVVAGPRIVPAPADVPNLLSSPTNAASSLGPLLLSWQRSDDNGSTWATLSAPNAQTLTLPALIIPQPNYSRTFQFRRVAVVGSGCSASAVSNVVSVTAIRANGSISGQVVSNDGITPVAGVTLTAVRTTTGLEGSPGSATYTAVTGSNGRYQLVPLYYGLQSDFQAISTPGSVTASRFLITPNYADPSSPTLAHVFTPASQSLILNEFNAQPTGINFRDLTTYAVSGQTVQTCPDCITGTSGSTLQTGLKSCPVNGVSIFIGRDGTQLTGTTSAFQATPPPGIDGYFATALTNPGVYTFSATAGGLLFVPSSRTLTVTSDVYNVLFSSPTSQTIQGRVTAGCGEPIGAAVLEFTDVLTASNGTAQPSCFSKRVTTTEQGFYEIVLPPRTYRVRAINLTPNATAGIDAADFNAFINALPADSLTRNLTDATAPVRLNLTYERPPTIAFEQLVTPVQCGTAASFALMEQNVPAPIRVRMYQGPVSKNCPVSGGFTTTTATSGNSGSVVSTTAQSGTLIITTNIVQDTPQTLNLRFVNGTASLTVLPGEPNIIAPHYRTFSAQFTDQHRRAAPPVLQNVLVTGVRSGTQTFETIEPCPIPLFVLHDPPGDGSSSFRETTTTTTQAFKWSIGGATSTTGYLEAKVGQKGLFGIGFLSEIGYQVVTNVNLEVGGSISNDNEMVTTTTNVSRVATSNQVGITGDNADLIVGVAMNMFYSLGTEVVFTPASCSISTRNRLAIAPGRNNTDYYYTVATIRNQVIPNLRNLIRLTADRDTADFYQNQINNWEQILALNDKHKREAQFVSNTSFNGGGNVITSSVSNLTTTTWSLDWSTYINLDVAKGIELKLSGLEAKFGIKAKFRIEHKGIDRTISTTAVTTGYSLVDANAGDRFTVDIGKDPAYGTPVFRLLAGESSCPNEPKTRPRDDFRLSAPFTTATNVPNGGDAVFTLQIGNLSDVISDTARSVSLALLPESNPNGAQILINGSPYTTPVSYNVGRLNEVTVTVVVRQAGQPNVFAYEGLRFRVTAGCGGAAKIIALSAYFQSPCSNVTLLRPDPNWVTAIADNNTMPLHISGYTLANLTNLTLQYTRQGTDSWSSGPTFTAAQLNNSPNGTLTTWNTTGLPDGLYDLRLKLTCPVGAGIGETYSNRASGTIDRTPPSLFGVPQPTGGVYQVGNTIGFTYDEPLACARLKSSNAPIMTLKSTGQVIPVSVGCAGNQVVIVPLSSLSAYAGEVLSLTMANVADVYGNLRTTPDTTEFVVNGPVAATGSSVLSLLTAVGNSSSTTTALPEDAPGTMSVVYSLPQPAPNNVYINFNVAGTANFGTDYTVTYASPLTQPISATVDGASGLILIPAGASSTTLLINPTADSVYEPDETVLITLFGGGDYKVGAALSVTATIANDDPLPSNPDVITSTKTGDWEDPDTWDLLRIPVATDEVVISPAHTVTLSTSGDLKRLTPKESGRVRLPLPTSRIQYR
jgi:hypothetical protein